MPIRDRVGNLQSYQRWLILGVVVAVMGILFFMFVWNPKRQEIATLKKETADLVAEIRINEERAAKLDILREQKADAERKLAAFQRELPLSAEAEKLLKVLAELGVKSGLDFKLWRPTGQRQGTGGLYVEHPVEVQVAGGYHALASFFDQIGHMQRIVNVSNLKMSGAKTGKNDELMIQTSFTATAFAASGAPPAPAGQR